MDPVQWARNNRMVARDLAELLEKVEDVKKKGPMPGEPKRAWEKRVEDLTSEARATRDTIKCPWFSSTCAKHRELEIKPARPRDRKHIILCDAKPEEIVGCGNICPYKAL